jgi:hypothetical protein
MSGIMNMFVAAKTTIATAVDAFFNLTTLLLNTSSTNGAQNNTFLDSSTNNFTITRNGNTTQGTFTPFSQTGWSNYFDGSGDYFSLASNTALTPASSTYTFECWVYRASSGAMTIWDTSVTNGFYVHINGSDKIVLRAYGTADIITSSLSAPVNSWFHVAVARGAANSTKMWINGSSTDGGSATDSTTYAAATTYIGIYDGSTVPLTGYISNLRLVKGSDVYGVSNSTITPPTAPLTAITNTSILTCQSNRFLDNSTNAFALTVAGNPSVQAFSPFAPTAAYDAAVVGGSGYFDGTGDYLQTTSNIAAIGTGDFSLEVWCYPTASTSYRYFLAIGSDANFVTGLDNAGYAPYFYANAFIITSSVSTVPNAWNFVQYIRSSGTLTVYVNGVSGGSVSYTGSIAAGIGRIGANDTPNYFYIGYQSSLRLSTVARSAVVPTAPLTNIANTALLLNYTNSGIFDSTAKNVLETVGNAQVSTTQAKWGTTSMAFDGTGDYLKLPSNALYTFGTGAYTIEFWIYPNSLAAGTYHVVGANATNGIIIAINNAKIALNKYGVGDVLAYNTALTTSTWTHVAIVREGTGTNQTKIYVNGTSVATGTDTNDWTVTTNFGVGANTSDGSQGINAYLDDLRITRGLARYTANFTAPTAAFALQ